MHDYMQKSIMIDDQTVCILAYYHTLIPKKEFVGIGSTDVLFFMTVDKDCHLIEDKVLIDYGDKIVENAYPELLHEYGYDDIREIVKEGKLTKNGKVFLGDVTDVFELFELDSWNATIVAYTIEQFKKQYPKVKLF